VWETEALFSGAANARSRADVTGIEAKNVRSHFRDEPYFSNAGRFQELGPKPEAHPAAISTGVARQKTVARTA